MNESKTPEMSKNPELSIDEQIAEKLREHKEISEIETVDPSKIHINGLTLLEVDKKIGEIENKHVQKTAQSLSDFLLGPEIKDKFWEKAAQMVGEEKAWEKEIKLRQDWINEITNYQHNEVWNFFNRNRLKYKRIYQLCNNSIYVLHDLDEDLRDKFLKIYQKVVPDLEEKYLGYHGMLPQERYALVDDLKPLVKETLKDVVEKYIKKPEGK